MVLGIPGLFSSLAPPKWYGQETIQYAPKSWNMDVDERMLVYVFLWLAESHVPNFWLSLYACSTTNAMLMHIQGIFWLSLYDCNYFYIYIYIYIYMHTHIYICILWYFSRPLQQQGSPSSAGAPSKSRSGPPSTRCPDSRARSGLSETKPQLGFSLATAPTP